MPLLKRAKPVRKHVRKWPQGATEALQDCFERTEFSVFREVVTAAYHIDINEYAGAVTGYIDKCIEDVILSEYGKACKP